jgi:diguanylate cyclase (GGDEF)-like protein
MELQILVPLIAAAIYLILLMVVVFQRPLQKIHIIFIIYLISAVIWSTSDAILRSSLFLDYKIIVFRVVICTSLWWVLQLYFFARAFQNLPAGIITKLGYCSLGILITLSILGIAPPSINYQDTNVSPEYGWWFYFYVTSMAVLAFWGGFTLIQRYQRVTALKERNKIAYLLLSIVLLVLFGFSGVSPLAHEFPISHLGGLISAVVLAYSIAVHQLVDVRAILRNILRVSIWGVLGIGAYLFIFSIIHLITGTELHIATIVIASISVLIVILPIYTFRNLYNRFVEQIIYRQRYKHRQKLLNFIRQGMSRVSNLKELEAGILPPLVKVLRCQQAYILLPQSNSYSVAFTEPPISDNSVLNISTSSPIVKWLSSQYLTRDDLEVHAEFRGLWQKEREDIEKLDIELFFPLQNRNNLIGILAIGPRTSGRYSLDDINMVESISTQFAGSLEKEYLQEELRKREQELAIINKLSFVMNSSLNLQDVYDAFVAGLREVIDVDFASIVLIDDYQYHVSTVSSNTGTIWKVGDSFDLKNTAVEWLLKNKKSLVELNLKDNSTFVNEKPLIKHDINSIIYVPLYIQRKITGTLIIASKQPNAFIEGHIHLLERLAPQIAISVENSQLYNKAEQRARIDELTGLFNRRHFDENLKAEIYRHSRYGNLFCLIFMDLDNFKTYNDTLGHTAGDMLLARVGTSLKKAIRNIDIPFRYGGDEFAIIMPHTTINSGQSVVERIRQILLKELALEPVPITVSYGLSCWPNDGLTADNIVNAADQALYHSKRTGGDRICQVSDIIPPSFEAAKKVTSSEKDTLNVIYALAATIEARDQYTYGHSQKVRRYAVALAEAIGLSAGKVAIVSHAALLHDIGKIGIYDEILNKKEKLSSEEFKLIRTHPQLSTTIIQHVPSLTPCLPAILYHHERWDGKGYPDGVKGDKIPIEARILAISDSFDAMTSNRPYKKPMSYEESILELKRCAGTQFDPELVEEFAVIADDIYLHELQVKT